MTTTTLNDDGILDHDLPIGADRGSLHTWRSFQQKEKAKVGNTDGIGGDFNSFMASALAQDRAQGRPSIAPSMISEVSASHKRYLRRYPKVWYTTLLFLQSTLVSSIVALVFVIQDSKDFGVKAGHLIWLVLSLGSTLTFAGIATLLFLRRRDRAKQEETFAGLERIKYRREIRAVRKEVERMGAVGGRLRKEVRSVSRTASKASVRTRSVSRGRSRGSGAGAGGDGGEAKQEAGTKATEAKEKEVESGSGAAVQLLGPRYEVEQEKQDVTPDPQRHQNQEQSQQQTPTQTPKEQNDQEPFAPPSRKFPKRIGSLTSDQQLSASNQEQAQTLGEVSNGPPVPPKNELLSAGGNTVEAAATTGKEPATSLNQEVDEGTIFTTPLHPSHASPTQQANPPFSASQSTRHRTNVIEPFPNESDALPISPTFIDVDTDSGDSPIRGGHGSHGSLQSDLNLHLNNLLDSDAESLPPTDPRYQARQQRSEGVVGEWVERDLERDWHTEEGFEDPDTAMGRDDRVGGSREGGESSGITGWIARRRARSRRSKEIEGEQSPPASSEQMQTRTLTNESRPMAGNRSPQSFVSRTLRRPVAFFKGRSKSVADITADPAETELSSGLEGSSPRDMWIENRETYVV
ncbi:MAG: hypothetical protein M1827_007523 [Pycnora praestabilis]|nr:MAG: hypothetical protein M1827_007523 [Pycnora praestabilis]